MTPSSPVVRNFTLRLFFGDLKQVLAIGVVLHSLANPRQLLDAKIAHTIGDFFNARHLEALALLDGLNVVGCLEKGVMRTRVQPRDAAAELLHEKRAFPEVGEVHIGDFKLPAARWLEP